MSLLFEWMFWSAMAYSCYWLVLSGRRLNRQSYRVLCPVHEEQTPSCIVKADGSYFCLGCGARGQI